MKRFAWLMVASLACGCGGGKGKDPQGVTHIATPATPKHDARSTRPELESFLVATVPERTLGPYLARRDGVAMVTYMVAEGGGRKIVAEPLAAENGKPSATARVVATASGDVDMLTLRATSGNRAGFVALWTSLTERGEAIELVGVADDGSPRGQSIEVARTNDNIVWVEVVPTPRGAICVWAEETRDQAANILGVALDPDGRPRGVPTPLAKGVVGWQAVPTTMGAGLALVTRGASATAGRNSDKAPADKAGSDKASPDKAGSEKTGKAGADNASLVWMKLDGDARPIGAPETIAARSFVGTDIDVTRVGDAWVFAWTDRSGFDPQIVTAVLDERTGARPPAAAVTAIGGARLVGLVSDASGETAALAWDESGRTGRSGRLHVTKLEASGQLAPDASAILDVQSDTPPVMTSTGRGIALLATARACMSSLTAEACSALPPVPMFIRLDDKFVPVQSEAMRLREQRDAPFAWGLSCSKQNAGDCLALAAIPDGTAAPIMSQVQAVHVAPRASLYRAPVSTPLAPDAPRPLTLTTIAAHDAFTDLAAAHVGDGTLLALVSAPPAVEDRTKHKALSAPLRMSNPANPANPVNRSSKAIAASVPTPAAGDTIRLFDLDPKGAPHDKPALLTNRALSVGGVAIAATGSADEAAVVWVARDGGEPQVHMARVDRHGKKLREQQLTNGKGERSDVAVGWAQNGWIVAWVDARDGNGEVYAARVSPELKVTSLERVTKAPGDASDLTLLARGDRVWLAFSDPRDSPHDGFADVYVAILRASDAKRTDEARVLATAAHSRSPVVAPSGDGVAVGWIEEAPMGTEPSNSAAYGAMVAWLDANARPVREPVRTGGMGPGFPTAIVFEGRGGEPGSNAPLRAVLARSTRDDLSLDALEFSLHGSAPLRVFPLLALSGPPSLDISLAFLRGTLFYNDGLPEEERVRRLTVGWK